MQGLHTTPKFNKLRNFIHFILQAFEFWALNLCNFQICGLPCCYAACSGNSLPTFRDRQVFPKRQ